MSDVIIRSKTMPHPEGGAVTIYEVFELIGGHEHRMADLGGKDPEALRRALEDQGYTVLDS